MHELYEIVTYTASLSVYADPLLDQIDPLKRISHRLFREHCTIYNNGFIKDLSRLGRNLKDVIIVDNTPTAYSLQKENAIPIPTWIDDINDTQLFELSLLLEALACVNDVRDVIRLVVKGEAVDYVKAAKSVAKLLPLEKKVSLRINHLAKDCASARKGLQGKGKKQCSSRQKDIYLELNKALQAKLNRKASRNKCAKRPSERKNCIVLRRFSKGCATAKLTRKEASTPIPRGELKTENSVREKAVRCTSTWRAATPQNNLGRMTERAGGLYSNLAIIYEKLRSLNDKKQRKKELVHSANSALKHYTVTGSNILCNLEESANKQLNLHSNSLDNTDWVACHEQTFKEFHPKAAKEELRSGKASLGRGKNAAVRNKAQLKTEARNSEKTVPVVEQIKKLQLKLNNALLNIKQKK
eukprot:TRINITY_DN2516_c0_g1_i2.p1 TRINITY_DN2516_c0_g1~~TRINITY_DN2516_c0_g1_i2.p1  ORF type:complete len:413 (+),score=110.88 TRINITY_DN2516_c0_g1_i2:629-1867(+)